MPVYNYNRSRSARAFLPLQINDDEDISTCIASYYVAYIHTIHHPLELGSNPVGLREQ